MFFPESFPPDILLEIRSYPGNDHCCDCSSRDTDWCSISHGTLICLECAGKHRSLGVLVSFVRSISMDSWSLQQVEMMRQGGNEQIKRFFRKLEIENSPIKSLYTSKGANHYRERLKEKVGKIMTGEIKSESRVLHHASRHRNTRSQSAIADLIHGSNTPQPLNGDKRKSSFEQYHVSFGDGPMGMTISKDFGGRALVSRLVAGGPAERNGVGVGDHITGVAKKRLDDYDEIMHMIPCLTRPIDIQFTRRIEGHQQHQHSYLHQHHPLTPGAHLHATEPISPGNVSRSMHGSKSMANLSLNLNTLDLTSPSHGNYRSKARIRTPRADKHSLGHIAEAHADDDPEEKNVRSPETFVRLVSFRTRSKDLESPTKLNFNDVEPQVVHVSSAEFSQTDQAIEARPAAVVLDLKPPSQDCLSPVLHGDTSSTKSSQHDSPLFLELSESSTPAPPTPIGASHISNNSNASVTSARSTESKDTRSHSVDLCKQIDDLLEGGSAGRLSLEDIGSEESPRPEVSRHASRQSMLGMESPESSNLSDQHVLFSGEGLTKKLTLHTLQNGTPIKVYRNEKWKSAILRRVHRDGSFKVTFRDGSTEAHVALQRLAMTTDTLRALSDWHACIDAAESFSDARLDEAFRAASQDGDGARASVSLSLRLEAERANAEAEAAEVAEGFSSPESSSYMNRNRLRSQSQQSVHSFRVEDLQPGVSEDFFVPGDADLDRWINSEEDIGLVEGSASEVDRDRASSFDSVLSDGRAAQKLHTHQASTNSNTFAAPAPLVLEVTYQEAPLGLRLSTNRSAPSSASNTTNNSPMPGHGQGKTNIAMSPTMRPSRQPEITKVVAGGRSEAQGVLVGDVLVQIEEHRIVDYTHAMKILQECTYPITLQFQRSTASFVGDNALSTKSLVDELLGVHKVPLALSPPQTRRMSFNRLNTVPVLELDTTPDASPHRAVHSARTAAHHASAPTA